MDAKGLTFFIAKAVVSGRGPKPSELWIRGDGDGRDGQPALSQQSKRWTLKQMHELWAVESLVQVIEQEGRNLGFSRVKQVRVKVGPLSHFESDALRFCFDAVSKGTIAEGACLELETVSAEGRVWDAVGQCRSRVVTISVPSARKAI